MKCLWHYEWVKLPRNIVPEGKGVLGDWARLASRAAFRKGTSLYCGYTNSVIPGMWAGGVVGLKSILGTKSRKKALDTVEKLQQLGYVRYELDQDTKKCLTISTKENYQAWLSAKYLKDMMVQQAGQKRQQGSQYQRNAG